MRAQNTKERDPFFDNAKFILILLVALGHGFELFPGKITDLFYQFIYLFHMPAFVLITGYFAARQKHPRFLRGWVQFLVFQVIFSVLSIPNVGFATAAKKFFLIPFWILWYAFCSLIWKWITPFITERFGFFSLPVALFLSLAAGYVPRLGYWFSVSRLVVFYPFYLIGYRFTKDKIDNIKSLKWPFGLIVFAAAFACLVWLPVKIPVGLLYGSMPYYELNLLPFGGLYRLALYLLSLVLSAAFFSLVPKQRTVFTRLGANTVQPFFIHGIIFTALGPFMRDVFGKNTGAEICFFLLLVLLIVFLSTDFCAKIFAPVINPVGFFEKKAQKNRM